MAEEATAKAHRKFSAPPTTPAQASAYKKDIHQSMEVLASLALLTKRQGNEDTESIAEIAMLKFCLSQLEAIKLRILKAQSEAKTLRIKLEKQTENIDEMELQKADVIMLLSSADQLVEKI